MRSVSVALAVAALLLLAVPAGATTGSSSTRPERRAGDAVVLAQGRKTLAALLEIVVAAQPADESLLDEFFSRVDHLFAAHCLIHRVPVT